MWVAIYGITSILLGGLLAGAGRRPGRDRLGRTGYRFAHRGDRSRRAVDTGGDTAAVLTYGVLTVIGVRVLSPDG